MAILLKNVIGDAPTRLFIDLGAYTNQAMTPDFAVTFPIKDFEGTDIDATAVTITSTANIGTFALSSTGTMASVDTPSGLGMATDLSVVGFCTITMPHANYVAGSIGNWPFSLTAADSAGGNEHVLAVGTVSVTQHP